MVGGTVFEMWLGSLWGRRSKVPDSQIVDDPLITESYQEQR